MAVPESIISHHYVVLNRYRALECNEGIGMEWGREEKEQHDLEYHKCRNQEETNLGLNNLCVKYANAYVFFSIQKILFHPNCA